LEDRYYPENFFENFELFNANNNNNNNIITAIGFLPGGSGYFTCIQNMKWVSNKFESGGLHEKHVVATWNLGTMPAFAYTHKETKKNLCRGGRSQDLPNSDF